MATPYLCYYHHTVPIAKRPVLLSVLVVLQLHDDLSDKYQLSSTVLLLFLLLRLALLLQLKSCTSATISILQSVRSSVILVVLLLLLSLLVH
jgi:hypothetical protein